MPNVFQTYFVASFLLEYSFSVILQGQLLTDENWSFLARFCLFPEEGRLHYDFVVGGQNSRVNLLLYFDSEDQWPSVYPSNHSCSEKLKILSIDNGQIISLLPENDFTFASGCTWSNENRTEIHCRGSRKFLSSRPRWWFIVLADCLSNNGLNLTYWVSLTNGSPGSFWREHFSADEFYILPILLITTCAYAVLLALSFYVALQLRSRRLLHVSYKIFMASIVCEFFGVLLEITNFLSRARRGIEVRRASVLGNILESCSETLFTVLMLILALGYTVTKSLLTPVQTWRLIGFVCISIMFQLTLFIYQSEVFDPGLVLYIYESPPGYILISLKLMAWVIFISCCYKTSRKTTTKTRFYMGLISLGSIWFLGHPLMVLSVTLLVDKWVRESVAKGSSLWIVFLGHAIFLYLTRPATNNTRFPFHIRTCQVVPIGGDGQSHSYQPRARSTATLFTVLQPQSTIPISSS
ncbi:transmembrane protein 145 [Orussus abietinus]|uniref:transmembrane protein 145 n=1 Tax=Orussus abietinus TaxID=222816 RepID=UPI0006261385|nr:transmembrane protein 145 [Orussus abietinus]